MASQKFAKRNDYAAILSNIKNRIQQTQTRAMFAVNAELVRLYWDIGRMLAAKQTEEGYGTAVIPRLARDIKNELPDGKGFSERNIGLMISFFRAYPNPGEVLQQPVAKVQELFAILWIFILLIIPWGHHAVIIAKVKDFPTRRWYMEQTLANGWRRNILALQIDSQAHARQGKTISNFAAGLPPEQSEMAQQLLKDPYIFDFLTLTEPFHDRELETELVNHV